MIVILCGPPGSGKTTLATGLQARLAEHGYAFDCLHSDDYDRRTYERLYERVADAEGHRIVDGTFYKREWRVRFDTLDDTYTVWVRASLEACLERNRRREASVSEKGVRIVHAEFEPPRADLEIDTERLAEAEALDRLENAVLSWFDD